jgi:homoserine kinase
VPPATVTAFAPATVANVAVGFDVLGFALDGVGDRVSATATERPGVRVRSVRGVVEDLPLEPERNTASAAVIALLAERGLAAGVELTLDKGIPLGSGMGGSAASAVAAAVATARLLGLALGPAELLACCMEGERAASGAAHADNAAPCLHGGLVALAGLEPPRVVDLPVPRGIACVLVRPHLEIRTAEARAALPPVLPLERHVRQSMYLCGFVAGCFRGDLDLVSRSMVDLVAEPVRAPRIPGFVAAGAAARAAGAIAFGIAGSGPSVFSWVPEAAAPAVSEAVRAALARAGCDSDVWVGPIGRRGAFVEAP